MNAIDKVTVTDVNNTEKIIADLQAEINDLKERLQRAEIQRNIKADEADQYHRWWSEANADREALKSVVKGLTRLAKLN